MNIRLTKPSELDLVMEIYDRGRAYMRQNGNLNQWSDGYPSRELIIADIQQGVSYVAVDGSDTPLAVFAFIPGEDVTYKVIENGCWLNDEPYCVIHRIAVAESKKGIASFVYRECMKKCDNLRIDTHRDNIPMQNCLLKNGFIYCGIIYLLNGDERLAYQKTKKENQQ